MVNIKLDIKRDLAIVASGGFFCRACLSGRSAAEASLDPRYCQGCYDFLVNEAALLTGTTRPKWIPRQQNGGGNSIPGAGDGYAIMAHSKAAENQVRHNYIGGQRRGPKPMALPEQRINELHQQGEGLGAEGISKALKSEGIDVSPRTVLRVIRGERRQEVLPLSN